MSFELPETKFKEIVCYYKANTLEQTQANGYLSKLTRKTLYSDEALTNQIGFTTANGQSNNTNTEVLAFYQCVFYIGKDTFITEYVKRNAEPVTGLLLYSSTFKPDKNNSGNITREILANGTTRKVTIRFVE